MVTISYTAGEVDFINLSLSPSQSATVIGGHDAVPGIDAWNIQKAGGVTSFDAVIWGDTPRQYVMRDGGVAWAWAPPVMQVRLTYGDHTADSTTDRAPGHIAHIATLGDGAGQAGLAGATPTGPAADLARSGPGFAGLSAERALDDATGALRRYGVRSEAVPGATLADLRAGQPILNLVRARDEFARLNGLYGGTAAVDSVTVLHGGGVSSATGYAADLVGLAGDIVQQTGARQVNVVPPSGTWQSGTDPAILGAVEALRTRGAVPLVLVSPLHWCGIKTGTLGTPDEVSMTMLAEMDALATAEGTDWHGPIAVAATRSGSTVNVDFEVMPGRVLVAPSYGVNYSSAAITAMTVAADPTTTRQTRLQITLASAAAGTLRIAYGATGTDQTRFANRCDLRDDWSAPSVTGGTLRRYALPAQFEVS